jgi:hypothetical protein
MNRLILFLIVLLIPHYIWGIDWNKGKTNEKNYYVVIPFENVNDKIIIPVTIANESYRFILDTGAPCSVSGKIADKIGLKADTSEILFDQSGIEKKGSLGYINHIAIAGISFDSIPTIIENENNPFFSCLKVDGIIGSSLLRNLIVQFSFQNQQVILTDQFEKLTIDSIYITPLILSEFASIPFFQFTYSPSMKNYKERMGSYPMFDSGSDGFISISGRNLKYSDSVGLAPKIVAKSLGSNTLGMHGAAKNSTSYLLDLPVFTIGNSVFINGTATTTTGVFSVIGTQLLKYGTVTIDYINRHFCFEPKATGKSATDVSQKLWPMDPTFHGDTLVVGQIWDDNLRKKIKVGDRILSINDINTEEIRPCDLMSGRLFKNIEKGTFKIENKDKKVIRLTLEVKYFK